MYFCPCDAFLSLNLRILMISDRHCVVCEACVVRGPSISEDDAQTFTLFFYRLVVTEEALHAIMS